MNQRYDKLFDVLGFKFNDPKLINQAFTHRSFLNESKQDLASNERLEFLGDSILSYIISCYIFTLHPDDEEGNLTNLRSFIVKTKSLAEAAQKLDLGSYLYLSKGEEQGGGRQNMQLLANTYEALLGATFLDLGIDKAKQMVETTLLPLFESEIKSGPPKDAKSELQEVAQNKTKQSPQYRIMDTYGPDHAKEFVVAVFIKGKELGRGVGNSKQMAEEVAAAQALIELNK